MAKLGRLNLTMEPGIQVQIRTAKIADKLVIALDFAVSVMKARQSCSTETV